MAFGDLAQNFLLKRSGVRLNSDLARLSNELATGMKSRPGANATNDVGGIAGIDGSLAKLDAWKTATAEARMTAGAMQAALGRIGNEMTGLQKQLAVTENQSDGPAIATVARAGRAAFAAIVGTLNTKVGGVAVFAGIDTDGPALADADTILAAIEADIATIPDPADKARRVEEWFAPAPVGRFDSGAYAGSTTGKAPLNLSPDDTVPLDVRADAPELRRAMAATARLALAAPPAAPATAAAMMKGSLANLVGAIDGTTGLQAKLGIVEAKIGAAELRNDTERTALMQARIDLAGADPYDTAVRLQQTEVQLETLYAMTARMSRLSLVNYL
ncbi:flagellin [Oceaniovalibus guishaninsula]|nr:flagellin [Oceaniovalibus guishaninsula]